ncbi:hypothetical protein BU24DRAFT_480705 [Aaosphaeria arxii CBS 175.79]|uniref:Uncharacterized protein n=1 Tax=Aaosphaeria arxii CBS 175.79 TaxID=1450172 RepID=A0A6A5XSQ5_9PLEO|nr:uncharacterized protein BU24DRAFT_480705 [Aaosphaeria arxii CBS 175.79]KAF2015973.1 hypothetical protein BU24DRAFT_480705 [Aaosphaeria arxii CBS 175.79]
MENSHKRKRKRIASPSGSDIVTSSKSDAPHSNSRRATYLPNVTDWAFRIKVISSPHTSDDLLREAIQGLIVTCFPDGILKELGIDVVQKHMREQAAPEENIRRVQAIFDQEMIYQIARMMAPLLGNEDRLRAGIDSVIAASYKLHSETLDPKNIIAAISDVQESYEQLLGIKGDPQLCGLGTSGAIRESEAPWIHDEQAAVKPKENPSQSLTEETARECQVSSSQSSRRKPTRLLTKTRRWDVDAAQVTDHDIPLHFKRPSDLFSYHAYPVIRRDLGDSASDSEILARIEMLLQEMSKAERQTWAHSLQKLYDGDLSMLKRVSARVSFIEGRATPFAPMNNTDRENQLEISGRGIDHMQSAIENQRNNTANIGHPPAGLGEYNPNSRLVNIKEENEQINKRGVTSVPTNQREALLEQPSAFNDARLNQTPNLLCSPDLLPIQCLLFCDWDSRSQNRTELSHVLVHELDKRVQATSFEFSNMKGRKGCFNKAKLESIIQTSKEPITSPRWRLQLENFFVPWVVTHPDAFPELVTDHFIFVHFLPFDTPITDLVFGLDLRSRFPTKAAAIQHVQAGLTARKVSEESRFASGGHLLWPHILECLRLYDTRGLPPWVHIDRALRYFVFQNRKLFPEIKNFALVKDWEKFTGSTW